jgi:phosphoribosyl 1,2-cyclic phosphodiesterase
MRFSVLASGSSGNACYVETSQSRILIDAGLSCRETIRRLELIDVDPESIQALIITHEHSDHIKGAGPVARRLNIPVYINRSTLKKGIKALGNLSKLVTIHTGQTITINDLFVETFTKCHDAVDPIGLVVASNGVRLGLVTDLGRSTRMLEDRLRGCQGLIVEFNHDEGMLEEGPYPLNLKRRIRGPDGHLSNKEGLELLKAVLHDDLGVVVLAHLSEANNLPEKAFQELETALGCWGQKSPKILLSHQDRPVPLVELS